MNKFARIISLILCVVFISCAFSSCSGGLGEMKPASAGIDDSYQLKLPVCNTDSLNPYLSTTQYNLSLSTLLFEGLVKVEKDFTATNVIAKSVSVIGNTVNVNLNPLYTFSDGSTIEASDIEYSFNMAKGSDTFSKQLENFEEISAAGNSVSFTLRKPEKNAVLCLDFPIVKEPKDEKDKSVIGSGKYKIESYSSLVMNERWHSKALPKVKGIRLVNMLDTASGPESVETGNISFYFQDMNNGSYVRKNVQTKETLMTNLVFLGINSNNEHLKKAEVRQAISLMIPKETVVEESFLGYGKIADTPFFPGWKELKSIRQSEKSDGITEATELLRSAGYSRNEDDVLSKIMRLRIIVNDDNPFKISAADNIADALKTIGIDAVVEKVPFDAFVGRLQRGEYELYIGETRLTKSMSLSSFFSYGGGSSYGIDTNSRVVSVYSDYLSGKVTLQRFVDYFDVAVPFVPICFRSGIEMYTNEMTVPAYGTTTDNFENIYSWYY